MVVEACDKCKALNTETRLLTITASYKGNTHNGEAYIPKPDDTIVAFGVSSSNSNYLGPAFRLCFKCTQMKLAELLPLI